jgi:EAL domain-containing protein (putative c-di-GMP-specific phosphodiesterase class I)
VVNLAHALEMRVVGEGVETPDQLDALSKLGCEYAQGYLLGRPQDASMWGTRPDLHGWAPPAST